MSASYVLYLSCDTDIDTACGPFRAYLQDAVDEHNTMVDKSQLPDAGFELPVPEGMDFPLRWTSARDNPVNQEVIDLGIRAAMKTTPEGRPTAFFLCPCHSLISTPFRLNPSLQIMDARYRGGTLKIALDVGAFPSASPRPNPGRAQILPLERLVQICAPNLAPFKVILLDESEFRGIELEHTSLPTGPHRFLPPVEGAPRWGDVEGL